VKGTPPRPSVQEDPCGALLRHYTPLVEGLSMSETYSCNFFVRVPEEPPPGARFEVEFVRDRERRRGTGSLSDLFLVRVGE